MPRPRIFVTRRLPGNVLDELMQHADVSIHDVEETAVPRSQLLQGVKGVHGILSMLTDVMDSEVFEAAGPQLRVVANMAVGFDNVDVRTAARRGITVTNTPDVLTETTADLTFALLLATARRIPEAERTVREGNWLSWSPLFMAGQDVFGQTLGIVGMGRIGAAVARRAQGFGMNVVYHNRKPSTDMDRSYASYVPLETLLTTADFVVVLVPKTAETVGLIGRRELDLMKPTSILIHTGRGGVVDEDALCDALQSGQIWAAGLDVFEREPLPTNHRFTKLNNVVLLPHIGSSTVQTRTRMAQLAARNLLAGLRGEQPPNRIPVPLDE